MENQELLAKRKEVLDLKDTYLDDLENYVKENPSVLPHIVGELIVPKRLVDVGTEMTIRIISYGSFEASLMITHDCFAPDAFPEPYPLHLLLDEETNTYSEDITIRLDTPGNTKLELWVNRQRLVRQIAVLDKGYIAVIPWIGENKPIVDMELHRFDLPGDYWVHHAQVLRNPKDIVNRYYQYLLNSYKYGDRVVNFFDARDLVTDGVINLFEMDLESQTRGLRQLDRMIRILGIKEGMELAGCYTPDAVSLRILEDMGVKGLTSLCAWQNWDDHGWKINHCGVSNQPYYPADDDFRRIGKPRNIMCFTMGNATCNRNYSIYALDGSASNAAPGLRYSKTERSVHFSAQRFFDFFDNFIADAKNNDGLMVFTAAIENFIGHADWASVNELAIRYMVKRAGEEKIVFASAADIADYHREKGMDTQEACFFEPDCYYGFHSIMLPGKVDDRIEYITHDYLAVVRRTKGLPMYFYDYTKSWESELFGEKRGIWGHVNPDEFLPSECQPTQVYREDMTLDREIDGNIIRISTHSETAKAKMVTGIFDVPFAGDFTVSCDKADVVTRKVPDFWTGNTHLFVDLGSIPAGDCVIELTISGTPRTPIAAELVKDGFGIMWFGDHAYMRSMCKIKSVHIEIDAPDGAYAQQPNGTRIYAKNGKLSVTLNTSFGEEAPILRKYPRELFEKALETAVITSDENSQFSVVKV